MSQRFQKQQRQRRNNISTRALLLLTALLLLPVLASLQLVRSLGPWILVGYIIVISCVTLWLYWHDKRQAENNGWRTPESTLHLAEIIGGWPTAFFAQRAFRHKISKTSYQVTFWAIVALHQAASFDFLHDWHYSRSALSLLHP